MALVEKIAARWPENIEAAGPRNWRRAGREERREEKSGSKSSEERVRSDPGETRAGLALAAANYNCVLCWVGQR